MRVTRKISRHRHRRGLALLSVYVLAIRTTRGLPGGDVGYIRRGSFVFFVSRVK